MPRTSSIRAPAGDDVTSLIPLIRRLTRGILRHRHDAEDAEQETLCAVVEHRADFQERGSFEGWVRCIAVRASLRLLRRRRWLRWLLEDVPRPSPGEPDPDETRRLYEALDHLSPRERAVFVLRFQEELPFAEVAAALCCSDGAARNYAFRASRKLRRLLGRRDA